ncbi:CLUMA_CG007065, isoform A, partial [Clunio marinus]
IHCFNDVRASCKTVPNLTKAQLELCYRANDVTMAAIEGLELAVKECQHQFRWNRWNCSSLSTKSRNPHSSNLFKRGYRESAFGHAISAAGVVHNVARACSQGRLLSCGCDPNSNRKGLTKSLRESLEKEKKKFLDNVVESPFIVDKTFEATHRINTNEVMSKKKLKQKLANRWKWAGCSHNIDFGIEFSEMFLDSREKAGDIQSQINLHNNKIGRVTVAKNLVSRCKCHGLSGSCQLKTCWKAAPDFRIVGKVLKQQFRRAILVDQSNFGNGMIVYKNGGKKRKSKSLQNRPSVIRNKFQHNAETWKRKTKRNRLDNSLFYFQKSPNFCEKDVLSDIPGTHGRRCNRTSAGSDSCSSLCCGRGYNLIKEVTNQRCNCRFHWCCFVECQTCEHVEWISLCN